VLRGVIPVGSLAPALRRSDICMQSSYFHQEKEGYIRLSQQARMRWERIYMRCFFTKEVQVGAVLGGRAHRQVG
jgi:hypothetical protein